MKRNLILWIGCIVLLLFTACNRVSTVETPVPVASEMSVSPTPILQEPTSGDPAVNANIQDELIVVADAGYQLKPGWDLINISYVYKWWGLGTPVFDWQEIEWRDEGYWKGGVEISPGSIQAFLDSIVHLYPTQQLLTATTHTDDYPSVMVEIIGTDGQRLLLISSSNDYGGAPWNIVYNGQLYAQYDGALSDPLGTLFSGEKGQPVASFLRGRAETGLIVFNTAGVPPQLFYGFTGLLPISDSFSYTIDPTQGGFKGHISGRESIADIGHMVIGRIDQLRSIQLTLPDETALHCQIEALDSHDPAGAAWTFQCPIAEHVGESYDYPIRVEFGTDADATFITEGSLWGSWAQSNKKSFLPLPWEIQEVLNRSESAMKLFESNPAGLANYSGQIDMDKGPMGGTYLGEISIFGRAETNGTELPYTINTQFEIHDNQLDRWELSQTVVDELFSDITQQPITQRVLAAEPDVNLTIWYAEEYNSLQSASLLMDGYDQFSYSIILAKCGGLPGEGQYPRADEPFRGFSFNYWRPQFILMGSDVVASDLDFWPNRPGEGAPIILMPQEFDTGEATPFGRVWFNRNTFFPDSPAELILWLNSDTREDTPIAPEDLDVYTHLADRLPVEVNKEYSTLWTAENIAVEILSNGQLEVIACENLR